MKPSFVDWLRAMMIKTVITCIIIKPVLGASEMAHQIKVVVTKAEDLSLILGTYTLEGQTSM